MNNYIDERLISYKRPQITADRYIRAEKGRPLARKKSKDGILMQTLRGMAAIFLLLLSTFGGDEVMEKGKSGELIAKTVKNCLIYGGILLALWGILVVLSNLVNAVSFLPTWSLILIFALTILGAAGVLKK